MTHSVFGSVKRSTSATNFTADRRSLRLGTPCTSRKHSYGGDKSQLPCELIQIAETLVPPVPMAGGANSRILVCRYSGAGKRNAVAASLGTRPDEYAILRGWL